TYSYSEVLSPINWVNSIGGSPSWVLDMNQWSKLQFGNRYGVVMVFRPEGGYYSPFNIKVENGRVETQLIFQSGITSLNPVGSVPIRELFPYANRPIGEAKVYKITDAIGIAFVLTTKTSKGVVNQSSSITRDAISSYSTNDTLAGVAGDVSEGLRAVFVRIGDFKNPFKSAFVDFSVTAKIRLISGSNIVTSSPVTISIKGHVRPQICKLTLDKDHIDFGQVTDSQVYANSVFSTLKLSSTCNNNKNIKNAVISLVNVNDGKVYSENKGVGFKILDNNGMPFIGNRNMPANSNNYDIKIMPFINNKKLAYGVHHSSLNMKVTYM
ncbi:fimbrial protein, partial [Photobacterium lucens]